jgi:hypothetical protein
LQEVWVEDAGVSLPGVPEVAPDEDHGEETEYPTMPYHDPTLAMLLGIAASGHIGMIVMGVLTFWNRGKGRRRA